ncbi:MAG: translocase [Gemmatimonadota bacterium]
MDMPTTSNGSPIRAHPSPLDRFLRLFTDVRAGEGLTVILLTFNVFLLLASYYFVKPVREGLILTQGGAELKSYLSAGQALLLLGFVPIYGMLASRMNRRRLLNGVTLFFSACLLVFFGMQSMTEIPLGVAFFLWVGIFNLVIVAQFWSFANDVYSKDEGERLFPIVAFGASAGAVAGAWFSGRLIDGSFRGAVCGSLPGDLCGWIPIPVGVEGAMIAGTVVLAGSLLITNWVEARKPARTRSGERTEEGGSVEPVEERMGDENPYALLMRNRYLLSIAFLVLFLNWINTTGGYILDRAVEEAAARAAEAGTLGAQSEEAFIGAFFSDFFAVVNVLGLAVQLFLVSRIIKYIGVRWAIMVLPLLAVGAYALLVVYPVLGAIRWAKTAENATDYSLNNTVRHALFLPTTREEKYKAKQAIDTLFWRAGDVLSALLVFVGAQVLGLATGSFALVNAGLATIWLVLAFFVGRRYRELSEQMSIDEEAAATAV